VILSPLHRSSEVAPTLRDANVSKEYLLRREVCSERHHYGGPVPNAVKACSPVGVNTTNQRLPSLTARQPGTPIEGCGRVRLQMLRYGTDTGESACDGGHAARYPPRRSEQTPARSVYSFPIFLCSMEHRASVRPQVRTQHHRPGRSRSGSFATGA